MCYFDYGIAHNFCVEYNNNNNDNNNNNKNNNN